MSATVDTTDKLAKMTVKEPEQVIAKPYNKYDEEEEILKENPRRFCLFPIKYHEVRPWFACLYSSSWANVAF